MELIEVLDSGELRCTGRTDDGAQCPNAATSETSYCAEHASAGFRDVPRFEIVDARPEGDPTRS